MCVYIGGRGGGGGMFDEKFVYVNTVCIYVFFKNLQYERYAPKAYLRKNTLRPHYHYHYYYYLVHIELLEELCMCASS